MRPAFILPALLLTASTALGASPNLAAIRPVGAQRGTEVTIDLTGAQLGDAREILYYQPGIETTKLETVADNHVKATIKIAPDCRPGLHDLRLRTATGVSALRTFSVGALKETKEVEPNNEFAKPQPVEFNSVVNGVVENEDVDYFVVDAKKGDRITAEVEGLRLGIFLFDPYVAILDARRFELAASDDAALAWVDAVASAIAPEDGKYIILVRECSYSGNGSCLYRLHVGDFPRPTATVPAGGKPGDPLAIRWIGDVRGERTTTVPLPAGPGREVGLFAQDEKGIAPHPNAFRASTFGNVVEAEPNDDPAKATPFAAPMALNGVIDKPGDVDFFSFAGKKGQTYDVRVFARALRSPLDSVLYVAKVGGPSLGGNDDTAVNNVATPDSALRFTAPDDGQYLVQLHDHLKKGGPDYFYRIEVGAVEPRLTLSVPLERSSQNATTAPSIIAVPKGNRQAILISAARADFAGDLIVGAEGLPAGVAVEADPMPAGQTVVPVLFTATAAAAPAAALARVTGKHTDPAKAIPTDFAATSELVTGQNNIIYWPRVVDRLAVAVTDEAPFAIDIVESKVPVVRNGSMALKVIARRKDGFKAPIAIALPWNPPGVASGGGVVIPEGQTEAAIPLDADGGAELRTWRVVVNGTAPVGNGPLMVSSQLAKLTVAAPFVNFAYQGAAVEQGKETDLVIKVEKVADFPGAATATLVGLPNKVTTDAKTITKDAADLVFHLKTDATSPAGNHTNLACVVVITRDGEPIVHNLYGGKLRVDVPIPPKPNAPPPPAPVVAAAPAPAPAPMPAAAPPKPLSRLEKLRLEQQEKIKAAQGQK